MRSIVESEGRVRPNGDPYVVSDSLIKKWMEMHKLKSYKTSAIHPTRAAKATVELRDHFFKMVDDYVKQLHAEGKVPWANFNEVPDTVKYGMDEEGADVSKGRAPALASSVCDGSKGQRRLYDICNEMSKAFHTTDAMTTRADGWVLAPHPCP
jgi:hypothetical protein